MLLAAPSAWGQSRNAGEDQPETVFTHRWEMGMTLHSRGMGAHFERGAYRGVGKISTWSLEVASMKQHSLLVPPQWQDPAGSIPCCN